MDPSLGTIRSDIINLNTALSKVFIGPTDPLIQISSSKLPQIKPVATKTLNTLQDPKEIRPPIRKILSEQRARKTLNNPSSKFAVESIKSKYQLPKAANQNSRQLGAVVYKKPKISKQFNAQVLPKEIRDNPQADPVDISEEDLRSGILRLIQRGVIPKAVDLSPAFQRGVKPVEVKVANFHDWRDMAPPPPPPLNFNTMQLEKLVLPDPTPSVPACPNYDTKALVLREEPRTYEEIIDSFSSHQIIIRKGRLIQSPEFQSFKRVYSEAWGNMAQAIAFAEEVFSKGSAPLVYIDGKKLANLVKDELKPLKIDELMSCVINFATVAPLLSSASQKYKSGIGRDLAAVKIQSLWKAYKDYSKYKLTKVLNRKAMIIWDFFKNWKRRNTTRQVLKKQTEKLIEVHQEIQLKFEQEYRDYKYSNRVEIHIFNTNEDVASIIRPEVAQFSQLTRMFLARNTLLTLIIVTPKIMNEEVKGYCYNILEYKGVKNPKDRVFFIHPDILEKHALFKRTSALLYFSDKTCEKIKSMVLGKKAYIVASKLNIFDVKLSVKLNVPIFSGKFSETLKFSSKSELKSLFDSAGISTAIWLSSIKTADMFFQTLAEQVYAHPEVDIWIFKMNREESSRGLAYADVSKLRSVLEARKKSNLKQIYEVHDLMDEVKTSWNSIIRYAVPSLYPNWKAYIEKFLKNGGVIQSTPSVNKADITFPCISFVVEPDGQVNFIATGDYLHSNDYLNAGCFFPQSSIAHEDAVSMTNQIGKVLANQQLFGYFTLQLVAFVSNSEVKPISLAVDLSFGLCRLACSYFYFHFIVGGVFDSTTGRYFMKCLDDDEDEEKPLKLAEANIYISKDPSISFENSEIWVKVPEKLVGEDQRFQDFNLYDTREFLICWEMFHTALVTLDLKNFFHMCRYEGVSYDLDHGRGITFIIYDLLKYGYISCMCVSSKRETMMKLISQVFDFFNEHIGPPPVLMEQFEGKEYKPVSDLIAKVKLIEKKMKPFKREIE